MKWYEIMRHQAQPSLKPLRFCILAEEEPPLLPDPSPWPSRPSINPWAKIMVKRITFARQRQTAWSIEKNSSSTINGGPAITELARLSSLGGSETSLFHPEENFTYMLVRVLGHTNFCPPGFWLTHANLADVICCNSWVFIPKQKTHTLKVVSHVFISQWDVGVGGYRWAK